MMIATLPAQRSATSLAAKRVRKIVSRGSRAARKSAGHLIGLN
jgi:hypothetical protein